MGSPHVIVIPYPAQGHVIPLMELSHRLVDHGFRVTFVNTELNHGCVVASSSSPEGGSPTHPMIRLVSIPDGLAPDEDRADLGRLCEGASKVMPAHLDDIIKKSNDAEEDDRITWMLADKNMAWALEVAKKRGLRVAALWPASAALLAYMTSIPTLIRDGILDEHGLPTKLEMIEIVPGIPPIHSHQFSWNLIGESKTREAVFRFITDNIQAVKLAEFIVCNSFYELEPAVFAHMPNLLPIGPLTTVDKPVGAFWPEDAACVGWLDEQPARSVVYVAFGSLTVMNRLHFQELALGLEMTGRPFLLVARPDLTNGRGDAFPVGFLDRVASRVMVVGWAPQQKVLAHPSVACFFSHCGWNSTIEGVRNGVPFLCRPYFTDQFLNQSYICDAWKVGLRMDPDDGGMILKDQVKAMVEELLGNDEIRARCQMWKGLADDSVREGGSSHKNLEAIVNAMRTASPT